MKQLLIVFIGGGIGTVFRYLLSKLIPYSGNGFPWSTFSTNLIGCFIIGILSSYFLKTVSNDQSDMVLFSTIGLCGGFTTFSTYVYENLNLIKSEDYLNFLIYTLISVILGIIMVYLGMIINKLFH
jgi:CrcB protein